MLLFCFTSDTGRRILDEMTRMTIGPPFPSVRGSLLAGPRAPGAKYAPPATPPPLDLHSHHQGEPAKIKRKVTLTGVTKFFSPEAQSISPTAIFGDRGSMKAMNIVTRWHYHMSHYCNS